ncbi:MAG: hypothetical protein R2911_10970 [Caldilineaceae bacterium]
MRDSFLVKVGQLFLGARAETGKTASIELLQRTLGQLDEDGQQGFLRSYWGLLGCLCLRRHEYADTVKALDKGLSHVETQW